MVSKHALKAQLRASAIRTGTTDAERAALVEDGELVLDSFFDALAIERTGTDGRSTNAPILRWEHADLADLSLLSRLRFDRVSLQAQADAYLERPWMASKEFDWLVLNVLTCAEVAATYEHFRTARLSIIRLLATSDGPLRVRLPAILWLALVWLLKWGLWLAIAFAALVFGGGIGVGLVVAITVGFKVIQFWDRYQRNRLLARMIRSYSAFRTVSQSWEVVWQELQESRAHGAVWDGVTYRLADERRNLRTIAAQSKAAHTVA